MLRFSRKSDYALLLLSSLASYGKGTVVTLREISQQRHMPYNYLSQIAPLLVEHGILGSKEGVGGGYFLLRDPQAISIREILELFEGPLAPVSCMRDGCVCEPHCVQKSVMQRMVSSINESMQDYTLADLVQGDHSL